MDLNKLLAQKLETGNAICNILARISEIFLSETIQSSEKHRLTKDLVVRFRMCVHCYHENMIKVANELRSTSGPMWPQPVPLSHIMCNYLKMAAEGPLIVKHICAFMGLRIKRYEGYSSAHAISMLCTAIEICSEKGFEFTINTNTKDYMLVFWPSIQQNSYELLRVSLQQLAPMGLCLESKFTNLVISNTVMTSYEELAFSLSLCVSFGLVVRVKQESRSQF